MTADTDSTEASTTGENADAPALVKTTRKRWRDRLLGFDVFISYAHHDGGAYARALHETLQRAWVRACLDERNLSPGDPLDGALGEAIRASRMLVVVDSPLARKSAYVGQEIELAQSLDKRVVVISREGTRADLPWKSVRELIGLEERSSTAAPSKDIVDRIKKTIRGPRVLARWALFVVLVIAAAIYGSLLMYEVLEEGNKKTKDAQEAERRASLLSTARSLVVESSKHQGDDRVWLTAQAYRIAREAGEPPPTEFDTALRNAMEEGSSLNFYPSPLVNGAQPHSAFVSADLTKVLVATHEKSVLVSLDGRGGMTHGRTWPGELRSWTADDRLLFGNDNGVTVQPLDGAWRLPIPTPRWSRIAWSPNLKHVARWDPPGELSVWDLPPTEPRTFPLKEDSLVPVDQVGPALAIDDEGWIGMARQQLDNQTQLSFWRPGSDAAESITCEWPHRGPVQLRVHDGVFVLSAPLDSGLATALLFEPESSSAPLTRLRSPGNGFSAVVSQADRWLALGSKAWRDDARAGSTSIVVVDLDEARRGVHQDSPHRGCDPIHVQESVMRTIDTGSGTVRAMRFDGGGRLVAGVGTAVRAWELSDDDIKAVLTTDDLGEPVAEIGVSSDGRHILAVGKRGTVFDLKQDAKPRVTQRLPVGDLYDPSGPASFWPREKGQPRILLAAQLGAFQWTLGNVQRPEEKFSSSVSALAVAGGRVVLGHDGGAIAIGDGDDSTTYPVGTLPGKVSAVGITDDGTVIGHSRDTRSLALFRQRDDRAWEQVATFADIDEVATSSRCSPIIAATGKTLQRISAVGDVRKTISETGPWLAVTLARDCTWVAALRRTETNVEVVRVPLDGDELIVGLHADATRIAIDPKGQTIATGAANGTLRLWRSNGHAQAAPIDIGGSGSDLESIEFSPDGGWILTGSKVGRGEDGQVNPPLLRPTTHRLYDLASCRGWRSRDATDWERLAPQVPDNLRTIGLEPDQRWCQL